MWDYVRLCGNTILVQTIAGNIKGTALPYLRISCEGGNDVSVVETGLTVMLHVCDTEQESADILCWIGPFKIVSQKENRQGCAALHFACSHIG